MALGALVAGGGEGAWAAPESSPPKPGGEALTLRQAIELALAASPDLAAARAGDAEGQAKAKLAGDAFRPEAFATSSPGVGRGLPVTISGVVPAILSVDLRKSLYDPSRRADELEARADAATARGSFDRARSAAARMAAEVYARCWSDQRMLAGAERRLAASGRLRARAEALREEGRNIGLESGRALLQEARAELRKRDLETARDLDLWELRRLTGWPADRPLVLAEDPLAALSGLPGLSETGAGDDLAAARGADPELRTQTRSLELLEQLKKLRSGVSIPNVEADAQYSRLTRANGIDQFYRKFRVDDWSISLSLVYPLYSGGRQADNLAVAETNLARLKEQLRARESQLELQIHRARAALSQAQGAAAVVRQAEQVAAEDLRITRLLAGEGRTDPDEVARKEIELSDTDEEIAKADLELYLARAQLLDLRGELVSGPRP